MYGKFTAVKNVSLSLPANRVHALIGPSGCGKSTWLRTLNRMHEMSPGGWIVGKVLLDGQDIYAGSVSPVQLRRRAREAALGGDREKHLQFSQFHDAPRGRRGCGGSAPAP